MAITFGASTTVNIGTAASTWSINSSAIITSTTADEGALLLLTNNSSVVTITSVTDGVSNAWAEVVNTGRAGNSSAYASLWAVQKYAPSTRVSIGLSGNSSGTISLTRWGRLGLADNSVSSVTATNGTTRSAGNVTPSTSNCLIVTFGRLLASTVGTNNTPATYSTLTSTNVQVRHPGFYKIQTTSSNETGQWTTSSNSGHAIILAAFKEYSSLIPADWGGLLMVGVQ